MSSIRRIRQAVEQERREHELWVTEVESSRIIVRPDNTSYIDEVGVYVDTIMHRITEDHARFDTLSRDYPNLTRDDFQACLKFIFLRVRGMI